MDPHIFFNGWPPLIQTLILGTLGYISVVLLLRVSGKRSLSKMSGFDMVVTIALGSALATLLLSPSVSLAQGVVGLSLLILLQLVNTLIAAHWPSYQRLVQDEPALIFFRGRFLDDALRRERVTRDEVRSAMRKHDQPEAGRVAAVVLESDGSISVLTDEGTIVDEVENPPE